jgi:predicted FMN-binding regulatory protein PaiB
MFVPSVYRQPDESWSVDLVLGNPLATLVTNGRAGAAPFATHLPIIPDPDGPQEWPDGLVGATLLGHLNRANPHWAAIAAEPAGLLTFTGPHAYISPVHYDGDPSAPTWDFTAVHLEGRLTPLPAGDETMHVVQSTVRAFEPRFGADWDMTESVEYFRKIVPAVGAFRFAVTRADGMFKLSQEKELHIRDRIRKSFTAGACPRHHDTADLIGMLPTR